jgi:hypothetical protein
VVGRDGAWIFASLERENRLCAIAHQMAAMREWLDRHRYARTRLVYDQTENALVISVDSLMTWKVRRSQGASTAKSHANRC